MANLFTEQLIDPHSGRRVGDAFEFAVRLPWYRSLPLSVVELGGLRINGVQVAAENVSLQVNERSYRMDELGELIEAWWFVLDSAYLRVPLTGSDSTYDVELTLNLYPPYIPGLTWVTVARHTLRPN